MQIDSPWPAAYLEPAMKLTLLIEAVKGSELVQRIIRQMQVKKLDEILTDDMI